MPHATSVGLSALQEPKAQSPGVRSLSAERDDLDGARGLLAGLLISAAIWALILFLIPWQ